MSEVRVLLTAFHPDIKDFGTGEWAQVLQQTVGSYYDSGFRKITLATNHSLRGQEVTNHGTSGHLELSEIHLDESPHGALATACMMLSTIPDDTPILVGAGDACVTREIREFADDFLLSEEQAGVVVFEDAPRDRNWSYVHLDAGCNPQLVTESVRPTRLATAGLFFFANATVLEEAATWCFVNHATTKGKYYVSSALNFLISRGEKVKLYRSSKTGFQKLR